MLTAEYELQCEENINATLKTLILPTSKQNKT